MDNALTPVTLGFEDYFKKQIDQLGKVLGQLLTGLLGLKSEGKILEGVEFVKQKLREGSGLDFDELISHPPEHMPEILSRNNNMSNENIDKIANIFFELADGLEPIDKAKSRIFFERSLALHEFLHRNETTFSFERQYKIEEIREALK